MGLFSPLVTQKTVEDVIVLFAVVSDSEQCNRYIVKSINCVNLIRISLATESDCAQGTSEDVCETLPINWCRCCFIKGESNTNRLLSVVGGRRRETLAKWNQLKYSLSSNVRLEGNNSNWCWLCKTCEEVTLSFLFTMFHSATWWGNAATLQKGFHTFSGIYLWISQIPGVCKLGEETDGKMILLKILTWLQHARCPPHAQCVRSLWGLMDLHPWALAHIKQFCQDPYVNASCYTWPYGCVLGAPWVGLRSGLPTGQIKLVLNTLCKDLPIRDIEENHHHHH